MTTVNVASVEVLVDENGVKYEKHNLGTRTVNINGHEVTLSFYARAYASGVYVCADHVFPASGKNYTFRCRIKFTRESWVNQTAECKQMAWGELQEKIARYYPAADSVVTDGNGRQAEEFELEGFVMNSAAQPGQVKQIDINVRVYIKTVTVLVKVQREMGNLAAAPESFIMKYEGEQAAGFKRDRDLYLGALRQQLAQKYRIA